MTINDTLDKVPLAKKQQLCPPSILKIRKRRNGPLIIELALKCVNNRGLSESFDKDVEYIGRVDLNSTDPIIEVENRFGEFKFVECYRFRHVLKDFDKARVELMIAEKFDCISAKTDSKFHELGFFT